MTRTFGGVVLICWLCSSSSAFANSGCEAYPLSDGLTAQNTDRGPKIMSTATVTVALDDIDEVLDSLKEAELTAKAAMAKFFGETIQSDETLDKAVENELKIIGEQKSTTKKTLKQVLTSIRDSAQALLKGVLKVGDCYTKGQLVRVTVGMKPETIAAASHGQQVIESGGQPVKASEPSTQKPLTGMDGFNNSSGIANF